MTRTYSQVEIEERAAGLATEHEIYDEDGRADVVELLAALGGRVVVDDDARGRSPASMTVRNMDDFTVLVPWNTSVVRDRFTIAHELGHLLLHYDELNDEQQVFYRYGRSAIETEANIFAAALLMPEEAFRRVFTECGDDFRCIAKRFDVSRTTAEIRARVLGLHS